MTLYAHENAQEAMLWSAALKGAFLDDDGVMSLKKEALWELAPAAWRQRVEPEQLDWSWTLAGYLKCSIARQRLLDPRAAARGVRTSIWLLAAVERLRGFEVDVSKQLCVGAMCDYDAKDGGQNGVCFASMPMRGAAAAGPRAHLVVSKGPGEPGSEQEFTWRFSRVPEALPTVDFVGLRVEEVDHGESDGNARECARWETLWERHAAWSGCKEGGRPGFGQGRAPAAGFVAQIHSCPRSGRGGVRIRDMGGMWLSEGGKATVYS